MIRRALFLLGTLLLAACAARAPLPTSAPPLVLPLQLHVQRIAGSDRQDWLLVVQAEGDTLRWSLLDPLGMPKARQILERGEWRNDGLLPPNPEARELFAALLFALAPDDRLDDLYPGQDWRVDGERRALYRGDTPRWRMRYGDGQSFDLDVAVAHYHIAPLGGAAP